MAVRVADVLPGAGRIHRGRPGRPGDEHERCRLPVAVTGAGNGHELELANDPTIACPGVPEGDMATYVSPVNWTEQGVEGYEGSVARGMDAAKAAEALGGKFVQMRWTMGQYDLVVVSEFPDDESASALALRVGAQGNIRTVTMRAYTASEMERIVTKTK